MIQLLIAHVLIHLRHELKLIFMSSKIYYFALFLFVFSCVNKSKKDSLGSPNIIDFTNVENKDSLISVEDLITDVDYLLLKTPDSLSLTIAKKVIEFDKKYLILDQKKKIVFAFDSNGNFIGLVGNKGGGPGEFREVSDFVVNDDKIIIYSRTDFSFYFFDEYLNFIEQIKITEWGTQISILPSNNIALYSYLVDGDDQFNINIYNMNGKLLEKRMFLDENGNYQAYDYTGFISKEYYTYPLSSRVYKINEKGDFDSLKFEIQFPGKFPENEISNYDKYLENEFNKTNDNILTKFEIGKGKEFICYYSFREGMSNGYTLGVRLSSGQIFGHLNLIHSTIDNGELLVWMFFKGPYNIPSYSKESDSYLIASNIESVSIFQDEINELISNRNINDDRLLEILSSTDLEETVLMRFKLKERL